MTGTFSGYVCTISLLENIPVKPGLEELLFEDFITTSMRHIVDGSNSNIFKARHKKLGKHRVVVKMVKRIPPDAKNAAREFHIEHETLSRLSHPHIVDYLGGGNHSDLRPFLVLEKLDGGSLMTQLTAKGNGSPFTYRRFLEVGKQFASALAYLQEDFDEEAIVIHRDLKPDNVGFTEFGVLKLMDFGLSVTIPKTSDLNEYYELTGNTGSLRYMAPEVIQSSPYNHKVDIYAFAIIMWQVATGATPFSNFSRNEFLPRVVQRCERPSITLRQNNQCHLSQEVIQILTECWENEPRLRLSAKSLYVHLCELCDNLPPEDQKRSLFPFF